MARRHRALCVAASVAASAAFCPTIKCTSKC
ncbi:class II lanthipeptide, LchA2/BrtA2 family [Streptomyces rimosus]